MRHHLSASIPDIIAGRSRWGAPQFIIALGLLLMSCSSKEPTARGPEARDEGTEESAENVTESAQENATESAMGNAPDKASGAAPPSETPADSEQEVAAPSPVAGVSGEPVSIAPEPDTSETTTDGLERAKAVKARHEDVLMRMPGVQGVGVGKTKDGRYAVTIFLLAGEDGADRSAIPTDLEGIPVEVLETGPIRARDGSGTAAKPK